MGTDRWREIADEWRSERAERFARGRLDPSDFERLRAAGLTRLPVPVAHGGEWTDVATSLRPICEALRILAAADPSPALVSAMHPAVLSFWLANEAEGHDAWAHQRTAVVSSAASGSQWGTVTSEPGSGGDVTRTRSIAAPVSGRGRHRHPGRTLRRQRRQALRQWDGHLFVHVHDRGPGRRGAASGVLPRHASARRRR
jgi:alkylation response protein AidB-like acyl-CoA dehydrogenase